MLINFDKHLKKLNDIRAGKVSEGLRLGVDRLDNHFRLVYGNHVHSETYSTTASAYTNANEFNEYAAGGALDDLINRKFTDRRPNINVAGQDI